MRERVATAVVDIAADGWMTALRIADRADSARTAHAPILFDAMLERAARLQLRGDEIRAHAPLLIRIAKWDAGTAIHAFRCDDEAAAVLRSLCILATLVFGALAELVPTAVLTDQARARSGALSLRA